MPSLRLLQWSNIYHVVTWVIFDISHSFPLLWTQQEFWLPPSHSHWPQGKGIVQDASAHLFWSRCRCFLWGTQFLIRTAGLLPAPGWAGWLSLRCLHSSSYENRDGRLLTNKSSRQASPSNAHLPAHAHGRLTGSGWARAPSGPGSARSLWVLQSQPSAGATLPS